MPGVGKTQLAIRFATLAKPIYAFVFWISATSVDKISTSFSHIYTLVSGEVSGSVDTLTIKAQKWLEANSNWLLVADNVNHDTAQHLRDLLPQADSDGNILITTRFTDVAESLGHARGEQHPVIDLRVLTHTDATKLFFAASKFQQDSQQGTSTELKAIEKLVSALGFLPLAIDHAAAFAKVSGHTPHEILKFHHDENRTDLYQWEHTLSKHETRSLATLFEPILEQIHRTAPLAYDILQVLAFLDPENLCMDMLERGLNTWQPWKTTRSRHILWPNHYHKVRYYLQGSPEEVRTLELVLEADENTITDHILRIRAVFKSRPLLLQNLQVLRQSSLLQTKVAEMKGFWMHELVQAFLRHKITSPIWRNIALSIVTTACLEITDVCSTESRKQAEVYVPHIYAISEQLKKAKVASLRLILAQRPLAQYLAVAGRYDEATRLSEQQSTAAKQILGEQHFETVYANCHLAWTNNLTSRSGEWVTRMEQNIKVLSSWFQKDDPNVLRAKTLLAEAYIQKERYQDAEHLIKAVVRSYFKSRDKGFKDLLRAIGSLAFLYYNQQRYDGAELLQRHVCRWLRRLQGEGNLRTIETMNNLACKIYCQGRERIAMAIMHEVSLLYIKFIGVDHPHTRSVTNWLEEWRAKIQPSLTRDQTEDQAEDQGQTYLEELYNPYSNTKLVLFLTDALHLRKMDIEKRLASLENVCGNQEHSRGDWIPWTNGAASRLDLCPSLQL